MAEKFDPYYTWLGIPPEDQPPDHYALLGVRQFESNHDVISNLTDQRMAHVKTFQAGPHGAVSQKLLNEIAAARVCLLNPKKRKPYDAKLRAEIAWKTAPEAQPLADEPEIIPPPPAAPLPAAQPPSSPQSDSVSDAFAFIAATARPVAASGNLAVKRAVQSRARQRARAKWLFITAPILGIAAVIVAITIRNSQDTEDGDPAAKSTNTAVVSPRRPASNPVHASGGPSQANQKTEAGSGGSKGEPERLARQSTEESPSHQKPVVLPHAENSEYGLPRKSDGPTGDDANALPKADGSQIGLADAQSSADSPGFFVAQPEESAADRSPVPNDAAQQAALARLKERLKDDYSRLNTSADRSALARKLQNLAAREAGDSAMRYAELTESLNLAIEIAADAHMASDIVADLCRSYAVDAWALRAKTLVEVARSVGPSKPPEERAEIAWAALDLVANAHGDDRWCAQASDLAGLALSVGYATHDQALLLQAATAKERLRRAKMMEDSANGARKVLTKSPNDLDANTDLGGFLCFQKDNWKEGLPYLAKGHDFLLKKIASSELPPPSTPADEFHLADAWWNAAVNRKSWQVDPWAKPMRDRAVFWYRASIRAVLWSHASTPGLTGPDLEKARQRIASETAPKPARPAGTPVRSSQNPVARVAEPFPLGQWVDVLRLVDTNSKMVVAGNWSRNGQEITVAPGPESRVTVPVVINGSYDFEVDFTRTSGGDCMYALLTVGSHPCGLAISGAGGRVSGLECVNGYRFNDPRNPISLRSDNLETGRRYRLLVSARIDSEGHASVDVARDGRPYLPHWAGDPASLSPCSVWSIPGLHGLGLGGWGSRVTFHSARLRMLSGSASLDPTLASENTPPAVTEAKTTVVPANPEAGSVTNPTDTTTAGQTRPSIGVDFAAMKAGGPFHSRSANNRNALIDALGGSAETERAVAAAISWLARHQMRDGSWSLQNYTQMCNGKGCPGVGSVESLSAATAMGLLPFLAAGETQLSAGPFKKHIAGGLNWLRLHQQADGDLSARAASQMYSHAVAAIALCEDYGMTHDRLIGGAAQNAINFIQAAQNRNTGGWRYHAGEQGDTSVVGWQLSALENAKAAGLTVDPAVLGRAKKWLASVSNGAGRYSYQPMGAPTPPMSAVGVLCNQYLNADSKDPVIAGGIQYLMTNQPDQNNHNIYYWYYATQAMHNMADKDWDAWNLKLRKILVDTQEHGGCADGSWSPEQPNKDAWGPYGGRIMMTSLSCVTLEIYYRYLPIYGVQGAAGPPR